MTWRCSSSSGTKQDSLGPDDVPRQIRPTKLLLRLRDRQLHHRRGGEEDGPARAQHALHNRLRHALGGNRCRVQHPTLPPHTPKSTSSAAPLRTDHLVTLKAVELALRGVSDAVGRDTEIV